MGPPLFHADTFIARKMQQADVPSLQRFFDDNPEYFQTVNGAAPRVDEAQQEFTDLPPPEMTYSNRWIIGIVDGAGDLVSVASILSDFLVAHVWHVGLFIVATKLHGRGVATSLYSSLENWMRANGAQWIRLGVVVGNHRAERFWQRNGYAEVRQRSGIQTGSYTSTVRVMVKMLNGGSLGDYLSRVERDRPDSLLP